MTFIASVVAKRGVAVIADSLVTAQEFILRYDKYIDYIDGLPFNQQGERLVNTDLILQLFEAEPIYTKDYEEKLIQFGDYAAITTTGVAYINDRKIADLVEVFKRSNPDVADATTQFTQLLTKWCAFLNTQVVEHLDKYDYLGGCVFLITHFEKQTHTTRIYRTVINEVTSDFFTDPNHNFVVLTPQPTWTKIVCDGQNELSRRLLYGMGDRLYAVLPKLIDDILDRLRLRHEKERMLADLVDYLTRQAFYKDIFVKDAELVNVSELSLQQAVDLASLLMRLEVDFQKYTKDIPTVGGVIKLAVIDEQGFRFIAGNKIEPPKHIMS